MEVFLYSYIVLLALLYCSNSATIPSGTLVQLRNSSNGASTVHNCLSLCEGGQQHDQVKIFLQSIVLYMLMHCTVELIEKLCVHKSVAKSEQISSL